MIDFQSSADGTKIAFERTGEGPALIIVGGALNSRRSADVLVPWLAPHFTVFAYDRRGRGESSDSPPYSPDREIEDLEALIAAAGGSAYAYGHSSGAILALEAAAAGAAISKLSAYEPPYLTGNVPEEPWKILGTGPGAGRAGCRLPRRRRGRGRDAGTPLRPATLTITRTTSTAQRLTVTSNRGRTIRTPRCRNSPTRSTVTHSFRATLLKRMPWVRNADPPVAQVLGHSLPASLPAV